MSVTQLYNVATYNKPRVESKWLNIQSVENKDNDTTNKNVHKQKQKLS